MADGGEPNEAAKALSAGSDKESVERLTDPPDSSDCSNHSTTDKDSSEVSDSDTRHGAHARNEAAAMPQPVSRPFPYAQPPGSLLAPSRLGNPFARVAPPPVVRSSADSSSTDQQQQQQQQPAAPIVTPARPVLAPSRLSADQSAPSGPAAASGGAVTSSRPVLRPSALALQAASLKAPETNGLAAGATASTFTLHPPKFNNPFSSKLVADEEVEGTAPASSSTESGSTSSLRRTTAAGSSAGGAGSTDTVTSTSGSNGATFHTSTDPRPDDAVSSSPISTSSGAGSFVFGENLQDRVTNAAAAGELGATAAVSSSSADSSGADLSADTPPALTAGDTARSLLESAEQYEKQRANKRKYQEVEVKTGEEDESNVLQINCKLYAFNKDNCSWLERGRGLLRLNDRRTQPGWPGHGMHSRLVFRTQGSLRLVLNTKIWPGMSVEKPSERDVRVTAMDNEQIKVFLIKCSTKDADLLFNALEWRLSALRSAEEEEEETCPEEADSAGVKKPKPQEPPDTQV